MQRVQIGTGKEGEYADINSDNKLAFEDTSLDALLVPRFLELLYEQSLLTNMYLSRIVGEELTTDDLDTTESLGE